MSVIEFYHYTSKAGRDAILDSGYIKASKSQVGDAAFGDGVYGTTLDPFRFSKWAVAANNYDNSKTNWLWFLKQGKVDYAFRIMLPSRKVKRIHYDKRKILLHKGNIKLDKYDFKVIKMKEYKYDDTLDSDETTDNSEETDSDTTDDSEETDSDEITDDSEETDSDETTDDSEETDSEETD